MTGPWKTKLVILSVAFAMGIGTAGVFLGWFAEADIPQEEVPSAAIEPRTPPRAPDLDLIPSESDVKVFVRLSDLLASRAGSKFVALPEIKQLSDDMDKLGVRTADVERLTHWNHGADTLRFLQLKSPLVVPLPGRTAKQHRGTTYYQLDDECILLPASGKAMVLVRGSEKAIQKYLELDPRTLGLTVADRALAQANRHLGVVVRNFKRVTNGRSAPWDPLTERFPCVERLTARLHEDFGLAFEASFEFAEGDSAQRAYSEARNLVQIGMFALPALRPKLVGTPEEKYLRWGEHALSTLTLDAYGTEVHLRTLVTGMSLTDVVDILRPSDFLRIIP